MSKSHLKFILAITVLLCQFSLVCAQPIKKEWIESFEKNGALKSAERIADRQSWSKEKLDAFDDWLDERLAARQAELAERTENNKKKMQRMLVWANKQINIHF